MSFPAFAIIDARARYGPHPTWQKLFNKGLLKIHAFEPEFAEFQRLDSLYKNNPNYILNNEGLGMREGTLTLNILKHHGQSSFHLPQLDTHWFSHHRIDDGTLVDTHQVKVVSLEN